jgi:transmembrane sensor
MKLSQEHIRRLLMEKLAGTISEEDDHLIGEEISGNPAVKARWEALRAGMQDKSAEEFLAQLDADRSWDSVAAKILDASPAGNTRVFLRKQWMAAAAAVLLLVSAGLFLLPGEKPSKPELLSQKATAAGGTDSLQHAVGLYLEDGRQINLTDSNNRIINLGNAALNTGKDGLQLQSAATGTLAWSTVNVPAKLDYRIVLSDGSEVWLNSSSSLRFPLHFSDTVREVFLQGEAFFKVAKNAKQPFIVHSPRAAIRVLGTSFNVHAYHSSQAIISLVEGSVKTSSKAHSVETTLRPGLEAVIDSAQHTKVRSFRQATTLSWMKGLYYFHDKPLAEIGEVLQRWHGLSLVFSDPSLAQMPVTGAIEKNQPLTDFLSSLQTTAGIKAEIRQNQIHLSR